jgi:hypothetical protein
MKQGAELVNQTNIKLAKLRKKHPENIALAEMQIQLTEALRWLEIAGATTKPEEQ